MRKHKQEHNHDPAQTILFNPTQAVARRGAPSTSHRAAKAVDLPKKCKRVLYLLTKYGPLTDEEMNDRAKGEGYLISNTGMAPARCMLTPPRGSGVRDSGTERQNRSMRMAVVWELDPTVQPQIFKQDDRLTDSQTVALELFKAFGPMTHGEAWCRYERMHPRTEDQMRPSSLRTRTSELVAMGYLMQRGEKHIDGYRDPVPVWGVSP